MKVLFCLLIHQHSGLLTRRQQKGRWQRPIQLSLCKKPAEPLALGPASSAASHAGGLPAVPRPHRATARSGPGAPRSRSWRSRPQYGGAPRAERAGPGERGLGAPPCVALREPLRSSLGARLLTISCLRRRSLVSRRARAAARRRPGAAAGPRVGSAAAAARPGCSSPRSGRARLSGTLRPSFCSTSRRSGAAPGSMAPLGGAAAPDGVSVTRGHPAAPRARRRGNPRQRRGRRPSRAGDLPQTWGSPRRNAPPSCPRPSFATKKSSEGERGEKPPPKLRGGTRPVPAAEPRYTLAAARPPRAAGSESSRVPAGCNFKARWQVEEARPGPPTVMLREEARLRRGAPAWPTGQPGRRLTAALRGLGGLRAARGRRGREVRGGREEGGGGRELSQVRKGKVKWNKRREEEEKERKEK